ncbi:hypothetical protein HDU92_003139 [Lobulomyces angularis]|nr:hypothetical protein HDU92_003139 [Lobulomyces angularis]
MNIAMLLQNQTNENKIHAVNLATAEYEDSDKKIIDSESRYKEEETILTTKYTNYLLSASESILKLKKETGVTLVINKLRCGLLESSTDMGCKIQKRKCVVEETQSDKATCAGCIKKSIECHFTVSQKRGPRKANVADKATSQSQTQPQSQSLRPSQNLQFSNSPEKKNTSFHNNSTPAVPSVNAVTSMPYQLPPNSLLKDEDMLYASYLNGVESTQLTNLKGEQNTNSDVEKTQIQVQPDSTQLQQQSNTQNPHHSTQQLLPSSQQLQSQQPSNHHVSLQQSSTQQQLIKHKPKQQQQLQQNSNQQVQNSHSPLQQNSNVPCLPATPSQIDSSISKAEPEIFSNIDHQRVSFLQYNNLSNTESLPSPSTTLPPFNPVKFKFGSSIKKRKGTDGYSSVNENTYDEITLDLNLRNKIEDNKKRKMEIVLKLMEKGESSEFISDFVKMLE